MVNLEEYMARNIVVGFDGSPCSESASLMAGWLAKQAGADVSLLRAVVPESGGSALVGDFKAALAAVDAAAARLRLRGVQAEGMALVGEPVRLLMRTIAQDEPLLVAVGTFGRRPVDNWVLGSVADKLARSSPVPVLLMPRADWAPPPAGRHLRVLAPLDGSVSAKGALTAVSAIAPATSVDATLLEVIDDALTAPVVSAGSGDGRTRRVLMDIVEDVRADTGEPELAMRVGQPAQQIIAFAQDGRYDLIALTRTGLGGNRQMLLGRVAEAVVRQSSVPVLVVPPAPVARLRDRHASFALPLPAAPVA
jgi:nucleotide-binding universal stress UspA family protein